MSESRSGRVDIVPQGKSHFEVRFFEGEKDKRYRSWSLPLNAAEAITRWWLRRSLPLGEVPLSGESLKMDVRADETCSILLKRVAANQRSWSFIEGRRLPIGSAITTSGRVLILMKPPNC